MISIGNKLGFFDFFVVEGVGNAGGIDVFGKQGVQLEVIFSNYCLIIAEVVDVATVIK